MVFNDVDEKGDYIRARRLKKHRTTRAICTECLLPFDYRVLSPSLFLCADCYDRDEGQKKYSIRRSWRQWLALLDLAGVPVEAHQALRKYRLKSKRQKLITLVQLAYYGETQ